MQKRHLNRETYFQEQIVTSRKYYLSYIENHFLIQPGTRVLEVGCGEGGNLIPFAERGCIITGVDRSPERTTQASTFFSRYGYEATFITLDFFEYYPRDEKDKYDIILIHDVIEHIANKEKFMEHLHHFLTPKTVIFWAFPAWQMPFGGHQQICRSKFTSHMPFIHLLPQTIYRNLLKSLGENNDCILELLDIKQCATTIERFEYLLQKHHYNTVHKQLWFINPHYEQKFGLPSCKLPSFPGRIPYIRNFFSTSCFYLTYVSKEVITTSPS